MSMAERLKELDRQAANRGHVSIDWVFADMVFAIVDVLPEITAVVEWAEAVRRAAAADPSEKISADALVEGSGKVLDALAAKLDAGALH
jgi:hypothetical protein